MRKVLQSPESLERCLGLDRWMGATAGGTAGGEALDGECRIDGRISSKRMNLQPPHLFHQEVG